MKRKTNEEFLKEVYSLVQDEYTFLDEYVNARTKIKVRHNKCNYVYEVTPHNFLQGSSCSKCATKDKADKERKTTEQFKNEVYTLFGDDYSVLGKYINNDTNILMKHNVCGNTWKVDPKNFLRKKTYCPFCKIVSKGETKIKRYLDNHNIQYEQHKKFNWLRYSPKSKQHLDFYLPDYNLAIEYDGEQHYKLVYFNTDKEYAKQKLKLNQERDNNKDKLLKEHKIKLIRISYTKFKEIDKILDKELKTK